MTAEKTYHTVRVNEPKKAAKFLIKYLDFFDDNATKSSNTDRHGITISSRFGGDYLLVQDGAGAANQHADDINTLHTDNCLRDYHQLKSANVKIEQIPRYTCRGLEVIFSDTCGNHYLLMEQRDYSEI